MILITIAPMSFAATVIWATLTDPETDPLHIAIVAAGLLLGAVFYFLRRKRIEVRDV